MTLTLLLDGVVGSGNTLQVDARGAAASTAIEAAETFTATVGVTAAAAGGVNSITAQETFASTVGVTAAKAGGAASFITAAETFTGTVGVTGAASSTSITAYGQNIASVGVTGAAAGTQVTTHSYKITLTTPADGASIKMLDYIPYDVTIQPAPASGLNIDIFLRGPQGQYFNIDTVIGNGVTTRWDANAPDQLSGIPAGASTIEVQVWDSSWDHYFVGTIDDHHHVTVYQNPIEATVGVTAAQAGCSVSADNLHPDRTATVGVTGAAAGTFMELHAITSFTVASPVTGGGVIQGSTISVDFTVTPALPATYQYDVWSFDEAYSTFFRLGHGYFDGVATRIQFTSPVVPQTMSGAGLVGVVLYSPVGFSFNVIEANPYHFYEDALDATVGVTAAKAGCSVSTTETFSASIGVTAAAASTWINVANGDDGDCRVHVTGAAASTSITALEDFFAQVGVTAAAASASITSLETFFAQVGVTAAAASASLTSLETFASSMGVTGAAAGTNLQSYVYWAEIAVQAMAAGMSADATLNYLASLGCSAAAAGVAVSAAETFIATVGMTGAAAGTSADVLWGYLSQIVLEAMAARVDIAMTNIRYYRGRVRSSGVSVPSVHQSSGIISKTGKTVSMDVNPVKQGGVANASDDG